MFCIELIEISDDSCDLKAGKHILKEVNKQNIDSETATTSSIKSPCRMSNTSFVDQDKGLRWKRSVLIGMVMYISLGRTVKVNSSWISLKASKDDFTNMFMQKFKHPTTQKTFINLFVTQAGFSTYRFFIFSRTFDVKERWPHSKRVDWE